MTNDLVVTATETETVLEKDVLDARAGLEELEGQIGVVRQELDGKRDVETVTMAAMREAAAVSEPLVSATAGDSGIAVAGLDDASWKVRFPEAHAAFARTEAARAAYQQATQRANYVGQILMLLEGQLPVVRGRLEEAEQKLEQHRAQRAAAMEQIRTKSWQDGLRRRVLGQP